MGNPVRPGGGELFVAFPMRCQSYPLSLFPFQRLALIRPSPVGRSETRRAHRAPLCHPHPPIAHRWLSRRGTEEERETGRGRPGQPPCQPCHPSPVIRLQSEISSEKERARIAGPASSSTTRAHPWGCWTRSQSEPDSVYKTDLSRPSIPSLLFLLTHTLSSKLQH